MFYSLLFFFMLTLIFSTTFYKPISIPFFLLYPYSPFLFYLFFFFILLAHSYSTFFLLYSFSPFPGVIR